VAQEQENVIDEDVIVVELNTASLVYPKGTKLGLDVFVGAALNHVEAKVRSSTRLRAVWDSLSEDAKIWYEDFDHFKVGQKITEEEHTYLKCPATVRKRYTTFEDWKNAGCPTTTRGK